MRASLPSYIAYYKSVLNFKSIFSFPKYAVFKIYSTFIENFIYTYIILLYTYIMLLEITPKNIWVCANTKELPPLTESSLGSARVLYRQGFRHHTGHHLVFLNHVELKLI